MNRPFVLVPFSSSIGWLGFEDEDVDEHEEEQVADPSACAEAKAGSR